MSSLASRTAFLCGAAAACALGLPRAAHAISGSAARRGPYCQPLRKGVEDTRFNFELPLLDGNGNSFVLADALGTAVWLNFFASWCPPCNAEIERLVQLADHYRPYGLTTVGIDVGEKPDPARAFRDRHNVTFPIALDANEGVFKGFGFYGLPTHVFFDRRGQITCLVADDLSFPAMDNEIAVALGGNSIPIGSPSPAATPKEPASPVAQ